MANEEKSSSQRNKEIWIAVIGVIGTIAVAVITGVFGLLGGGREAAAPADAGAASPVAPLSVSIEGPLSVALGETAYYTIVSQNAARAEWSIGGFNQGQSVVVDPLPPSHQIWVTPSDATRVGDTFTIAVTVTSAGGRSAMATHQFQVTAASP